MSKTEIRYQKNGKERILRGWLADLFLNSFKKPEVLKDSYEITGFDFFSIKGKLFETGRLNVDTKFTISKDTAFCLEDCSFEDVHKVIFKGERITLKDIFSKNYMRIEIEKGKDIDLSFCVTPEMLEYCVNESDGKLQLSGDGSTSILNIDGIQNLSIHNAQNIYFHCINSEIENVEIVHSHVNLWSFRSAKVLLRNSIVRVSKISAQNQLSLYDSKFIIEDAYFMKHYQEATIYDQNGIIYVNDEASLLSKIGLLSVLKGLQKDLESRISVRQEKIMKLKVDDLQRNLQEKEEQIIQLKEEKKELENRFEKTSQNVHLHLTRQKIKEIK